MAKKFKPPARGLIESDAAYARRVARARATFDARSAAGRKGGGSAAATEAGRRGGWGSGRQNIGRQSPKPTKWENKQVTCVACGGNKAVRVGKNIVTCTACSGYGWQWQRVKKEE